MGFFSQLYIFKKKNFKNNTFFNLKYVFILFKSKYLYLITVSCHLPLLPTALIGNFIGSPAVVAGD